MAPGNSIRKTPTKVTGSMISTKKTAMTASIARGLFSISTAAPIQFPAAAFPAARFTVFASSFAFLAARTACLAALLTCARSSFHFVFAANFTTSCGYM